MKTLTTLLVISEILASCLFFNSDITTNSKFVKEDLDVSINDIKITEANTNLPIEIKDVDNSKNESKKLTFKKVSELKKNMSVKDVIDMLGTPDMDLGSGVYYYVYNMDDEKYKEAHLIFKGQNLDEVKLLNGKDSFKIDLKENAIISKKIPIEVKNAEITTKEKKILLTYDQINKIEKNTSINDVVNILGLPDADLGSGTYHYVYHINDEKYKEAHLIFEGKYLKRIEFINKDDK